MATRVLSEAELRSVVGVDQDTYAAVAEGFAQLARGKAATPPVIALEIAEHRGEIDVKTAYLIGWNHIAVKIASGFLDNPSQGLPYSGGMMVVMSARIARAIALEPNLLVLDEPTSALDVSV